MAASIDESVGVLARHIRAILDRLERHEDFLHRINDYLSKESGSPQIGVLSPIQTQTFLYLIKITEIDGDEWVGVRQEAITSTTAQNIPALSDRPVRGFSAGAMPEVGDTISAFWIGNVDEKPVYVQIEDVEKFVIVRGTVTAKGGQQVTIGSVVQLPTWAKYPGATVTALDVHNEDPEVGTTVEVIYDESSPTGWALLRAGSGEGGGGGSTVEFVSVEEGSGTQSSGDPVGPILVNGNETFIWSGFKSGPHDIWIVAADGKWKGRRFLPANGVFMGKMDGTYDPNVFDPANYPTSDLRPLYRIEMPQTQEIYAKVTTAASEADLTGAVPSPSTDGRCTTYYRSANGVFFEKDTDVAFENYSRTCIRPGAVIKLEHYEGALAVLQPVVGPTMVCGFVPDGTPTAGDPVDEVSQSVYTGKLVCWNGGSLTSNSSYDLIEDVYLVMPLADNSQAPRHLQRMTAHWIGQYNGGSGDRDLYLATPQGEVRTRNFRLKTRKTAGESSASVIFVDDGLSDVVGQDETIYDPHGLFHGSADALGVATEVLDPSNGTYRWEITKLEAAALNVIATLGSEFTGSPVNASVTSYFGPQWEAANPGGSVSVTSSVHTQVATGSTVVATRKDPNVDPPQYEIIEIRNTGGGGEGGLPDAGCGLEYADATTLQVDVATLAGSGLGFSTSPGECDKADDETSTHCCLYVDYGCGLSVVEGKLTVNTNGCITCDPENGAISLTVGCGLQCSAGALTLDFDALIGCGLVKRTSGADCTAGIGGEFCCIAVDPAQLDGCGLKPSGTGCELMVDHDDLVGTGLKAEGTCALGVNYDPNYFTIINNPGQPDDGQLSINCAQLASQCGVDAEVITGCADPFVTFDASGNPTFHFIKKTIRVLAEPQAAPNADCPASGALEC